MPQGRHCPSLRSVIRRAVMWRVVPLLAVIAIAALAVAMGWHRQVSLETLVRHRAAIDSFVAAHRVAALLAFMALYAGAVTASLPGASVLTVAGGIIFGAVAGGLAAVTAATLGATMVFLVVRRAVGRAGVAAGAGAAGGSGAASRIPTRFAGPVAEKLAAGFRRDAFCYLVFLRLVPLFPFWLVNLVPAAFGVGLVPFVAATALGILPGAFAYAFFGAGLDSAVAAEESAYRACLAGGAQQGPAPVAPLAGCRLDFDLAAAATPELIGALIALGLIALVPPAVRLYGGRRLAKPFLGEAEADTGANSPPGK
jgi:uncharacterized membrane protein YdjX (TVP38/TMEM64 family)